MAPALVHPCARGAPLRARHPGRGARAVDRDHEPAERKRMSAGQRPERTDWAGCGIPKNCSSGPGSDGALAKTGSGDPRDEGMVLAEQVGGEGRY